MKAVTLILLLIILPYLIGRLFEGQMKEAGRNCGTIMLRGQLLLWTVFFLVTIPVILLGEYRAFPLVVKLYSLCCLALLSAAVVFYLVDRCKGKEKKQKLIKHSDFSGTEKLLAVSCLVLFAVQVFVMIFGQYTEGDDTYYVAVAAITEGSDTMYRVLPYTGMSTGLDARHGLAPFPIWIAYLSRVSGVHSAVLAHTILPVLFLFFAYSIIMEFGKVLFPQRRENRFFFLLLMELLILFGGYSNYSTESFLLVRAAQGKAVLAALLLPYCLLVMYKWTMKLAAKETPGLSYYFLLCCGVISACLCSTQGAVLMDMLIGCTGLCIAFCYRRFSFLPGLFLSCAPSAIVMGLYLFLR